MVGERAVNGLWKADVITAEVGVAEPSGIGGKGYEGVEARFVPGLCGIALPRTVVVDSVDAVCDPFKRGLTVIASCHGERAIKDVGAGAVSSRMVANLSVVDRRGFSDDSVLLSAANTSLFGENATWALICLLIQSALSMFLSSALDFSISVVLSLKL